MSADDDMAGGPPPAPSATGRVTLFPASFLGDWEWQFQGDEFRRHRVDELHELALPTRDEGDSATTLVVQGLDEWSDPQQAIRWLQELQKTDGSPWEHILVPLGWQLFAADVLPPLRAESFEIKEPESRRYEDWLAALSPGRWEPGLAEVLFEETGRNLRVAQVVLEHLTGAPTFATLAPALDRLVQAEDGLLGHLRRAVMAVSDLAMALSAFVAGRRDRLTGRERFYLLATGLFRPYGRGLEFAGRTLEDFVSRFFTPERLARHYREQQKPHDELAALGRLVASSDFTARPRIERAQVHRRLAELTAEVADEEDANPPFFEHVRAYLGLVGDAERVRFLKEFFAGTAEALVTKPGYAAYRVTLERFLNAMAILINRHGLRLYSTDPNPDAGEVICLLWKQGEQYVEPHVFHQEPGSLIGRLVSGDVDKIDTRDIFTEAGFDEAFVRRYGIRSLIAWPLASQGRRFGALAVDNPYDDSRGIPLGLRSLAESYIERVAPAVERAALIGFDVRTTARLKLLVEALKADEPDEILSMALRLVHEAEPRIEVAAIRLHEGQRGRRRRLMARYPTDDPDIRKLAEELVVVVDDTADPSSRASMPAAATRFFDETDLDTLPDEAAVKRLMRAKHLKWWAVVEFTASMPAEGDFALPDASDRVTGQMTFYGSHPLTPLQKRRVGDSFQAAARQVQLAVENILRREQNQRRAALLAAIGESFTSMARTAFTRETLRDHFLKRVLEASCRQFDADVVHCLRLVHGRRDGAQEPPGGVSEIVDRVVSIEAPDGGLEPRLRMLASAGALEVPEPLREISLDQGVTGRVVRAALAQRDKHYEVISDVNEEPWQGSYIDYVPGIRSTLVMILRRLDGGVLGALTLESRELDHFDARSVSLAATVGRSLAQAIEFVELFESLARESHIREMGSVMVDMAHWLGNVVPLIRNRTQRALEALRDPTFTDRAWIEGQLEGAIELSERVHQMREDLRPVHLTPEGRQRERVDLVKVVHAALRELPERATPPQVVSDAPSLVVQGIPAALHRMVHALVRNAQDAVELQPEPTIRIVLASLERDGRQTAQITITDNGPGMDPSKLLERMQPFKSTKPPTRGTGLGLYSARNVAMAHGGTLNFKTAPGEGLTVRVNLPLAGRVEEPS
jgi:signal transduction histidine kinase